MKNQGKPNCKEKPDVDPRWHGKHALVFRHCIQRIQHLYDDQDGQRNCGRCIIIEYLARHAWLNEHAGTFLRALIMMNLGSTVRNPKKQATGYYQLFPGEQRSVLIVEVPPHKATNSGSPDIQAYYQVPEEQPNTAVSHLGVSESTSCIPSVNNRVITPTRALVHDVLVRRILGKCCGRQAISDQVYPEQLHGDEYFWQT